MNSVSIVDHLNRRATAPSGHDAPRRPRMPAAPGPSLWPGRNSMPSEQKITLGPGKIWPCFVSCRLPSRSRCPLRASAGHRQRWEADGALARLMGKPPRAAIGPSLPRPNGIMIERTKMEFASEFWRFMRVRKKFWLLPILIMTFVFGGLAVLTKGSAIAPFVYTLF